MYINKNVFKSNKFKNEYIDYSGFLHTSIRSYSVNHKIRNGIGKVFNLDNILKVFTSFSIGLILRWFINDIFNVNVFIDYTHLLSVCYYIGMACIIIIINEWFSYINMPNINISNIPNIIISNISIGIKNISVGIKNLFKDNGKIMINGNGSYFTNNKNGSMGVKSMESCVHCMDNSQEQIGKGKGVDKSSRGPSKPFSKDELAENNFKTLKETKLTEENKKKIIYDPNLS